jgi:hypothetical protein
MLDDLAFSKPQALLSIGTPFDVDISGKLGFETALPLGLDP